ncbi:lipoprotein insertase outer membrane protein LolB [Methylocaldum sp.]|uniref:lipoprotein insertase outer membrane protein LolB n=1 Tax=Methylocaldum sp. TaxID=1969727 RepID=UPI002D2E8ABB|nr:lipoprotein insertase outer membrane protein LolB [Methylocaldum sp.]HYE34843.1 lipoprotein insertase outer membrane protein LolB [Methylocaldum sp.]
MFKVFVLALIASLAGCAVFEKEPGRPVFPPKAEENYDLKAWRLEGRIGVQTTHDAWHANLFWEHDADQDRLRVSGPFSQGMVSIILQKDLIYVNGGGGIAEFSRDPDAMLKDRLGFAVPLSSLRYWVMGLPDPNQSHTPVYEESGSSRGFQQSGWTLRFERYVNVGDRIMPQKMAIQGPEVKLKLIADSWQIRG